jgi:hypothetical protein
VAWPCEDSRPLDGRSSSTVISAAGTTQGCHYKAAPVLVAALDRAFNSPRDWQRFVRFSTRYRLRQLNRWLDQPDRTGWAGKRSRYDRIVWQLDEQLPSLPASTGALEAKLDWLREQLERRRFALRNRERTNDRGDRASRSRRAALPRRADGLAKRAGEPLESQLELLVRDRQRETGPALAGPAEALAGRDRDAVLLEQPFQRDAVG